MKNGDRWSQKEKDTLKSLYSLSEIGEIQEKLGRTKESIRAKASILQIKQYPITLRNIIKRRTEND